MSGGVFISYRRSDSAAFAGRIADFFKYNYGDVSVFFDIGGIAPGEDFVEVLRNRITSSEVVLAIIGEDWLTAEDQSGRRRLDDPEDFVRIELTTALSMGARVIPVLLDGAKMPAADILPEGMEMLSQCNAELMRGAAFERDAKHLGEFVHEYLANSTKQVIAETSEKPNEAGSPVFEALVEDFEDFENAPTEAFIIVESEEGTWVQFAKTPDDEVFLDLPLVALETDQQREAADRFFNESYSTSLWEGDHADDFDTYNIDLPMDASYLAHVTLEVFQRIYDTVPEEPLIAKVDW